MVESWGFEMSTIRELLSNCKGEYQLIHECAISASIVKRTKHHPAHCKLTIATQFITPLALLNPKRGTHVGVVVWTPMEEYERLTK